MGKRQNRRFRNCHRTTAVNSLDSPCNGLFRNKSAIGNQGQNRSENDLGQAADEAGAVHFPPIRTGTSLCSRTGPLMVSVVLANWLNA
jgi:hypothetical protein